MEEEGWKSTEESNVIYQESMEYFQNKLDGRRSLADFNGIWCVRENEKS